MRVLLVDHDARFRKKIVAELSEAGLQVDPASSEEEGLGLLQAHSGRYELVLAGSLGDPAREKALRRQIHDQYSGLEMIMLTGSQEAWQTTWPDEPSVACSVGRRAGSKVIATLIKLSARYPTRLARQPLWQTLTAEPRRPGEPASEEELYLQLYEEAHELLPGLDVFLIAQYDGPASEVSFPFAYKDDKRIHIKPRRGGNNIADYVFLTKTVAPLRE